VADSARDPVMTRKLRYDDQGAEYALLDGEPYDDI
jgi:hypothetical protein